MPTESHFRRWARIISTARFLTFGGALLFLLGANPPVQASENAPSRPFAQWADLPAPRQFVVGLVYEESESYHIYAGSTYHNVTTFANGEEYGIDINQGWLSMQYGISERWAADLSLGYTTAGWRFFDDGVVQSTTGLMDWALGVRYQIFKEDLEKSKWLPTLTFRAGAVLPGSYDENFAFAPGNRSAAIQPSLLLRKHFAWSGFGLYTDASFRWNRTTHNDQYTIAIGFFQKIKDWELDAGYRHMQTIDGSDIILNPDNTIVYPRDVREIYDAIEAGFSYTTPKLKFRYGFHTRTIVDGSNTDAKFWVGGSVDFPIGGRKSAD